MSSLREQIIAAVTTKMGSISGATAYRSRAQALRRDESPAIFVKAVGDTRREIVTPYAERDLLIEIGIIVRSDIPEQTADPIAILIHAAMYTDPTLGGLAIDITEQNTLFEEADADGGSGATRMQYSVYYRHTVEALDS